MPSVLGFSGVTVMRHNPIMSPLDLERMYFGVRRMVEPIYRRERGSDWKRYFNDFLTHGNVDVGGIFQGWGPKITRDYWRWRYHQPRTIDKDFKIENPDKIWEERLK